MNADAKSYGIAPCGVFEIVLEAYGSPHLSWRLILMSVQHGECRGECARYTALTRSFIKCTAAYVQ